MGVSKERDGSLEVSGAIAMMVANMVEPAGVIP
jgi:hypothetical protein